MYVWSWPIKNNQLDKLKKVSQWHLLTDDDDDQSDIYEMKIQLYCTVLFAY